MSDELDTIRITALRCYGYTGYLPEEQTLGQWFSVDLELWVDLRQAGSSDRLEATVDYGPIVQAVQTLVKASRFQLLESLAEAIASLVLEQTGIPKVRVSLTKLNPPIPDFSGQVTLVITRP